MKSGGRNEFPRPNTQTKILDTDHPLILVHTGSGGYFTPARLSTTAENRHNGSVRPTTTADEDHPRGVYDLLAISFVGLLLIANIAATKLFVVGSNSFHLIFDGGALLFPLTYILGDVIAEVYGFRRTRRVIVMGFALSALAAVTFWVVQLLPPAADYAHQAAFEAVLGFVPRIVVASLLAFLTGQLLNAYVLVAIKRRWGERHLWIRLLGSSVVGEAADTLVFCTIAFFGVLSGAEFLNYLLVGYVYKLAVEVIFLPLTYPLVGWVKNKETAGSGWNSNENEKNEIR